MNIEDLRATYKTWLNSNDGKIVLEDLDMRFHSRLVRLTSKIGGHHCPKILETINHSEQFQMSVH